MPCKSFPIIYGFIERSDLDTILKIWKNIEIPPIPNKKDVSIIINEMFLIFIFDNIFNPFVISNEPKNSELGILTGILKKLQNGLKII